MKPAGRALVVLALALTFVTPAFSTTSKIKLVDWRDLSDRKLTETGQEALDIHGDAWHHAETAHFIYHFRNPKEADTVIAHAELYYAWVKELLELEDDHAKWKSNIFVFDDRTVWKEFASHSVEKLPGAEAFTNGPELFMYRDPFWVAPQRVLAHEIAHLTLFRFIKGTIPLFLNEGLAEFVGTKALAMKAGGNDYAMRTFELIPETDFLTLETLSSVIKYPEDASLFYRESELFTRYLMLNHPPAKFKDLIQRTAGGEPLQAALKEVYETDFEKMERDFRNYAMTRDRALGRG